jgi:hypothetical protein
VFVVDGAPLFMQSVVTCVHGDTTIFMALWLQRWFLMIACCCCTIIHATCSFTCQHVSTETDLFSGTVVAEVVLAECLPLMVHHYSSKLQLHVAAET